MSLGNLYALSRALMHESTETLNCNSEQLIQVIITGLPASADRLEVFSVQANDSICSKLNFVSLDGHLETNLKEF